MKAKRSQKLAFTLSDKQKYGMHIRPLQLTLNHKVQSESMDERLHLYQ